MRFVHFVATHMLNLWTWPWINFGQNYKIRFRNNTSIAYNNWTPYFQFVESAINLWQKYSPLHESLSLKYQNTIDRLITWFENVFDICLVIDTFVRFIQIKKAFRFVAAQRTRIRFQFVLKKSKHTISFRRKKRLNDNYILRVLSGISQWSPRGCVPLFSNRIR